MNTCANCGAQMAAEAAFCGNCGATAQSQMAPAGVAAAAPAVPAADPTMAMAAPPPPPPPAGDPSAWNATPPPPPAADPTVAMPVGGYAAPYAATYAEPAPSTFEHYTAPAPVAAPPAKSGNGKFIAVLAVAIVLLLLVAGAIVDDMSQRSNLDKKKTQLATTTRTLNTTKDDLSSTKSSLDSANKQLADAKKQLDSIKGNLTQAQSQLDLQSGELESLKKCLPAVDSAGASILDGDVEAAKQTLDDAKADCDKAFAIIDGK